MISMSFKFSVSNTTTAQHNIGGFDASRLMNVSTPFALTATIYALGFGSLR
jgi:hypothetical protein